MGSSNVKAIIDSDFIFNEHHIICFAHTIHNTIINTLNKSTINDII